LLRPDDVHAHARLALDLPQANALDAGALREDALVGPRSVRGRDRRDRARHLRVLRARSKVIHGSACDRPRDIAVELHVELALCSDPVDLDARGLAIEDRAHFAVAPRDAGSLNRERRAPLLAAVARVRSAQAVRARNPSVTPATRAGLRVASHPAFSSAAARQAVERSEAAALATRLRAAARAIGATTDRARPRILHAHHVGTIRWRPRLERPQLCREVSLGCRRARRRGLRRDRLDHPRLEALSQHDRARRHVAHAAYDDGLP